MVSSCPNCDRSLADAEEARFCMFCGYKLKSDADNGRGRADPEVTADYQSSSTSDEPPTRFDQPPERVGGFRLLRKLGSGGMGQVYEAESDESGERVAVKLLSPDLSKNATSVARFKQEGRLASQISHPRCVFVYGVDADAGRPFIVMELMPGTTLKDLVDKSGPLPWVDAIRRMLDVVDGLIEAHRLGVLHRDVKPSNCFLTDDDRVKVGDFGLSKSLDDDAAKKHLTATGGFVGTVLFASPESIRGEEVSYDSDVYSVAATLYFLLTGKAPHQHHSLTAALAKVISEPPPGIRSVRSDVPAVVERVVFTGLERDRKRRYSTLEEQRDALLELLPERQQPARVRSLVGAYLVDVVVTTLLIQLPISATELLTGWYPSQLTDHNLDPLAVLGTILYFTIGEGIFGTTFGKWLVGLRVTKVGQVGPPGLRAGFVRTIVWTLLTLGVTTGLLLDAIPVVGRVLSVFAALGCAGAILAQLFRPLRPRGVHDLASGCRVVQRLRPEHRAKFVATGPDPIDEAKTNARPVPELVGGFAVLGELTNPGDGSHVWVAEDRSLNRSILILAKPVSQLPDELLPSPVRPGRLRVVAYGDLVWDNTAFGWAAFAAPSGAPLLATLDPDEALGWADTRLLVEQLVAELRAGLADGSTPPQLTLDHLWVEPAGRLHLLEFPIYGPKPSPPADGPAVFVRQLATAALEGRPRSTPEPVAAPIPRHAMAALAPLFTDQTAVDFDIVADELARNHSLPAAVTTTARAAHLGMTVALCGLGVTIMTVISLGIGIWSTFGVGQQSRVCTAFEEMLADPEQVARLRIAEPAFAQNHLTEEKLTVFRDWLAHRATQTERLEHRLLNQLTSVERWVVTQLRANRPRPRFQLAGSEGLTPQAFSLLERLQVEAAKTAETGAADGEIRSQESSQGFMAASIVSGVVVGGFCLFAVVFRGGLSYTLSGIALVNRDGRPAGRLWCGLRELLIWLPFLLPMGLFVVVTVVWPNLFFLRAVLAGGAVVVMVSYLVLAVRFTEQVPQDRLLGLHMVPN